MKLGHGQINMSLSEILPAQWRSGKAGSWDAISCEIKCVLAQMFFQRCHKWTKVVIWDVVRPLHLVRKVRRQLLGDESVRISYFTWEWFPTGFELTSPWLSSPGSSGRSTINIENSQQLFSLPTWQIEIGLSLSSAILLRFSKSNSFYSCPSSSSVGPFNVSLGRSSVLLRPLYPVPFRCFPCPFDSSSWFPSVLCSFSLRYSFPISLFLYICSYQSWRFIACLSFFHFFDVFNPFFYL